MNNDMHEGDMAEELAEREYVSLQVFEMMAIARRHIRDKWLDRAMREPQDVREAYNDMTGENSDEM